MSDQSSTPATPALDSFWQDAVDMAGGAGGLIGFAHVDTGFKVYFKGLGNKASFFPAPNIKGSPERAAALEAAKAAASMSGAKKPPSWSINMYLEVDKSFSRGKPATWKEDRYWTYDLWTEAAKDVVLPALMAAKIHSPWSGWVRLGFRDDPFGGTEENQDGETVVKQVAYVAEVFPTEAAARAAAMSGADGAGPAPSFPPNYTEASWKAVIPMIKAGAGSGTAIDVLATNYAVPVPFIAAALAE